MYVKIFFWSFFFCSGATDTLTSLLVQHNQSPDASIFALFPREDHMTETVEVREGAKRVGK